jgi:catechol 2,3-dioxygenase-like lactoylglutathione lyase family enzyme
LNASRAQGWDRPPNHFIVSSDVERSKRFYTEVLGGETVLEGEPTIVALANGWVTINVGGGPTEDKPTVTLEPPSDLDHTSSFLNIRVADIGRLPRVGARGAEFVTPPIDRGSEIRCYMRDPDGHLMLALPNVRGTYATSASSTGDQPSARVRISGPCSVTAMVCSKCEARDASVV